MVCTNCGSENKPTRRFCRDCGHPLKLICPVCGASNDPTDNFCGECGAALNETPPEQPEDASAALDRDPHERRFVTVLFADLVGFTQFSESRDDEIVRAAVTTYFDQSRDVITRFGGVVDKFIGDAVMAIWGATVAHEDDAERAVRAGMELIDVVARLGDELDDAGFSLRVGVLTGEASVAPASPEQGFIVGDLVNTASRLQSIAEPGTVVVGGATYGMLHDTVQFEPLGDYPLKGKAAPVAVWQVVLVKPDRTQQAGGGGWEPAFVSREEELRLLKDALHATERAVRSRLVSIVGEAGIGKTRLAGELRRYVDGLAVDVYWHDGRSPAYDQGLTFWALGEMVRQRAGIAATDDALRSRTKLLTAVTEYVSSPADQQWIEPRLAALLGLEEASPGERGEFFAAVVSFFQHIAERGTTVLVFEDFHWADPGLIEFVRELVERSTRHPILVVTLARPDLLDRAPGWGAGRRNFTSAHLGPLTDAEMMELVTGLVQGIDGGLAALITERANGIPLYAVELVRMLLADGDLVVDDNCCTPTRDLSSIRVPDTVRAVVEARLDRLSPEARALLQDAAVMGAAFTCAGLAAMSGLDTVRLDELLEPLVRRELLEFESDSRSPERGQYRFVQSMIREVAYGRLTRGERRVRHIRAAEFFAALGDIELAGAVASHYMAAHGVTDATEDAEALAAEATGALSDAADRAARLHAHSQALALIEEALTFITDPRAEAALWKRAARSASALAQHETAVGYAYRALDWHRSDGDPVDIASAVALVGSQLCHAFRALEAIEILEPVVSDSDLTHPCFVRAAAELARAYLMALRNKDAAELSDRVIGSAETFDLTATIVDALITRGTSLGNLGRLHEAVSLLRGATLYAKDHDLPLAEMRAANNLGHLLAFDDHLGAMDACRTGMEQANRLGDVRFIGSFSWAVSAYLDRDGRFDEGQALRDDVRDRIELPAASLLWYELTDLMTRVERGDTAAVEPAFDAVRRSFDAANPQSLAGTPLAMATLNMLTGDLEAAYTDVMSLDKEHRFPEHLVVATVAAALLGDADRLEAVAQGLASGTARGRMSGAMRSAARAALAALDGRTDEAVKGFSSALSFRFLRLDRAKLQALFATMVGREVPEACKASDAAFEVFAQTGATTYLDLYAAGMPPAEEQLAAGN